MCIEIINTTNIKTSYYFYLIKGCIINIFISTLSCDYKLLTKYLCIEGKKNILL